MSLPTPYYQDERVTIYRADAREVLPAMPGQSCQMVFTDPPYGHNNNNGDLIARWEEALGRGESGVARPIANDGPEANEVFRAILPELRRVLMPGCCCCCCCGGGGGPDPQFARWSLWINEVFDFKQMIVWDKGPMGMGWHYRRSYETVLVGQVPGAACRWFDESSAIENIIRPGDYGIKKIIPSAADHPTPKPVELAAHFIRLHSQSGDTVCDPFAGAGSTAEAAIRLGRKFVGVEIDEQWAAIAVKRIREAYESAALFETPPVPRQMTLEEA